MVWMSALPVTMSRSTFEVAMGGALMSQVRTVKREGAGLPLFAKNRVRQGECAVRRRNEMGRARSQRARFDGCLDIFSSGHSLFASIIADRKFKRL